MDQRPESEPAPLNTGTTTERRSPRELVVTRVFDAPARLVFEAWSRPELIKRWWVPKSFGITLLSCEADVRTGGTYRFVFANPGAGEPLAFVGRYIEVTPHSRIVWTNEESADGAVTTVTFEEKHGQTLLVLSDLYPSQDALEQAIASGSTSGYGEQFAELDVLLAALDGTAGPV